MKIVTTQQSTRFMRGNLDIENVINDILIDAHGCSEVYSSDFDTDNAIYSNGFIDAIEEGKIPMLELHNTDSHRFYNELEEYHHVIINDECFNVYFKANN